MPHKTTARLARKVVEDLKAHGVTADALLRDVGLRRADLSDPDNRIPYPAVIGLIERAAATLDEASYGLRLGAAQDARDSGLLGFVVLNSATLLDALANLQRYFRLIGEGVDLEIERLAPNFVLRFRETEPSLRGLRHNSEYLAAILVQVFRDMTRKRISPVRAEFMHGRPNRKVDYERYLGCPVRFHADWDAVIWDADTVLLPVVAADRKLLRVLQRACRQVLGPAPGKKDLVHELRERVIDRLTRGPVLIDDVARDLGLGAKTLERRLGEHGETFTSLLDDIRRRIAEHHLAGSDVRLAELPYLTGYSEQAAFTRAFKRWTGTTPQRYREKMQKAR